MIDSKRLIEVMPRLSGNEYKVFVYLLYGYDMARNAYSQPYYERSQSEIAKDTGVPVSTLKRAVERLEALKMVSRESFQHGVCKTRTRYYILDYDQYLVHNEPANGGNIVQNGLDIIDKNKEKESEKRKTRPDLNDLYTKSRNYGDALGVQTTIEGINRIKDEFVKLWDEAGALYVYESKYHEDKTKNWEAFRKRYDGVKSRINKRTNTHTPKQEGKKDKRESSEMNGEGGGTLAIVDHPLLFSTRFKMQYENGAFDPSTMLYFLYATQEMLKATQKKYSDEQINGVLKELYHWVDNSWWDDDPDKPLSSNSQVSLTPEEWKYYASYLLRGISDRTVEMERNNLGTSLNRWLEQHRNNYEDCF